MSSSLSAPPQRASRILGLGVYRPIRVVGNDEVAARIGRSSDWIEARSGIRSRRFAGPQETVTEMAVTAAGKALAAAGTEPDEIDLVLVATTTHLTQMPSMASAVAHQLGSVRAGAMDISAACAGFCYALGLADSMVRSGGMRRVLVIGSERVSDILDHDDPTTAFLFGDGAGAVLVGDSDEPGIGPVVWGLDGSRPDAVGMTGFWTRALRDESEPWPVLGMSGWKVYRWAVNELVPAGRRALSAAGVEPAELAAFIPHQANAMITEQVAQGLQLPEGVALARDIAESGNTSAASIPLAMDRLLSAGEARSGGLALLMGFGSGLVYAGQVVVLP